MAMHFDTGGEKIKRVNAWAIAIYAVVCQGHMGGTGRDPLLYTNPMPNE
jgi:hypothetical protein